LLLLSSLFNEKIALLIKKTVNEKAKTETLHLNGFLSNATEFCSVRSILSKETVLKMVENPIACDSDQWFETVALPFKPTEFQKVQLRLGALALLLKAKDLSDVDMKLFGDASASILDVMRDGEKIAKAKDWLRSFPTTRTVRLSDIPPPSSTSPSPSPSSVHVLVVQCHPAVDYIQLAQDAIDLAKKSPNIVVFPEDLIDRTWSTNSKDDSFTDSSFSSHPQLSRISEFAKRNKVYIVGGTGHELDTSTKKLYNTSVIFDKEGKRMGTYRLASSSLLASHFSCLTGDGVESSIHSISSIQTERRRRSLRRSGESLASSYVSTWSALRPSRGPYRMTPSSSSTPPSFPPLHPPHLLLIPLHPSPPRKSLSGGLHWI